MMATLGRHWAVLSSAWALDAEQAKSRRRYSQTEFLPRRLR